MESIFFCCGRPSLTGDAIDFDPKSTNHLVHYFRPKDYQFLHRQPIDVCFISPILTLELRMLMSRTCVLAASGTPEKIRGNGLQALKSSNILTSRERLYTELNHINLINDLYPKYSLYATRTTGRRSGSELTKNWMVLMRLWSFIDSGAADWFFRKLGGRS
ncbi:hypothetical protein AVEN_213274-1 [Araneus ventricosus]|uniref:Uncharacterized protein n=1 Tax=Araneus ventricosus TaxID=182803 RepID=A0A4Y2DE31_ARAVE|nr:hypothetical protein AVEN_213274-1 [Araneus ventricosus]